MKPIHSLFSALCFFTLVPLPVRLLLAQTPSSEPAVIVNFDRRESRPGGSSTRKALAEAEAALQAQLPAVQVDRHPFTGSAQFISSPRGFLTGPKGAGVAAGTAARALPESDGLRGLKAFLRSHRAVVGQGEEVLNSAALRPRAWKKTPPRLRLAESNQRIGPVRKP